MSLVHDSYVLHISPDVVHVIATDGPSGEAIQIDRLSGKVTYVKKCRPTGAEQNIYGLMGMIDFLSGPCLITISKRTKVGTLQGHDVFRIDDWEFILLAISESHLSREEKSYDRTFKSMLENVLDTPAFYYSTGYDLTHTCQRIHKRGKGFGLKSLYKRAYPLFAWNRHLMKEFVKCPQLGKFLTPVIHGFVDIKQVNLMNGASFQLALLSRRSSQRAGTRFTKRGADEHGNVANFVETEMIIYTGESRSSLVQTRGSIPLLWTQTADASLKPAVVIAPEGDHEGAARKHFERQVQAYGKQVVVNLIDQRGPEEALGAELAKCLQSLNHPDVHYEPFDFHHECKGMNYDKVQILVERVSIAQDAFGFFMVQGATLKSLQDGVIRTNCIDCLDRTNLVQSMFAKRSLATQLIAHGVIGGAWQLLAESGFDNVFMNLWADNGDMCSEQYAGTAALKSDFTRTGKRSFLGALKDGYHSVVRYIKNNLSDGRRQDAIDLLLGNYRVVRSGPCPLAGGKLLSGGFAASLVSIFLLSTSFLYLLLGPKGITLLPALVIWIIACIFVFRKHNGSWRLYIDQIRLRNPFRDH